MSKAADDWNMIAAKTKAQESRDDSRKCGCAIFRNTILLVSGCNQFPEGVEETPERKQRPDKYTYTEHAERNAIYEAARRGVKLADSTAYLNWFPCVDCARALVQAGVIRLVCYEPEWENTIDCARYGFEAARIILTEGEVAIEYLGKMTEQAK